MSSPLAYNTNYALNAICPYFTMFPLEYPIAIIRKHKHQSPTVIDPMCGRGTTLYAARKAGLHSHGVDISPIAVAIARAKLATTSTEAILDEARAYFETEPQHVPDQPFFRHAYSSQTLKELCSLREGLLRVRQETDQSTLLRAAALGCLHGPRPRDLTKSAYFSNQMPRTFAPKPDYSVRYWRNNNLEPPRVSLLAILRRRLERISDLNAPAIGSFHQVLCADARDAEAHPQLRGRLLVITSPPYYGMRTYLQDQWLRHWFLGGPEEVDYNASRQLRHCSHDDFIHDLARIWTHTKTEAHTIDLYVRFGTIPSVKSNARELLRASLEKSGDWVLVSTRRARTASNGKRQADQMHPHSNAADEFDFHAIAGSNYQPN